MKYRYFYVRLLVVGFVFVAMLMGGNLVSADVNQSVTPGPGESNWTTPWAPDNVEGAPGFIDFEGMAEGQVLGEVIPGVKFITTEGEDWRVGRWSSGNWNGKYPTNGQYTSQGDCWGWLGTSQGAGKIVFTQGKATYFTCLTSTYSGLMVDAYDEDDNLLVTSGMCSSNLESGNMSRLTVISPYRNIQYVVIHDTGNYWVVDCISTDAPGVDLLLSVPSFKQYDSRWRNDEMVPGRTIGQIGCAMTSVAMILASYGFDTIDIGNPGEPDIHSLDPGTLNTWLKKHNGYLSDGSIIWNSINSLTSQQLVYGGGGNNADYDVVNNDLANRRPVILRETGHFVVARGKHTENINDETENYFFINDPGHTHETLDNTFYNNNWFGYVRYSPGDGVIRPALTIRMHSPAEILITDKFGRRTGYNAGGTLFQEIPGASVYEVGPVYDLETGLIAIPVHKEIYLPDVDNGPYNIAVFGTGMGRYELDVQSCDSSSEFYSVQLKGSTYPGKIEEYIITNSTADARDLEVKLKDAPAAVPGVSLWGIFVLLLCLGGTLIWMIQRRQIRS